MTSGVLRKKPVIYVKDYHNVTQTILNNAYNIQENRKFGDMYDLSFDLPYYQFDGYNNLVVDESNIPVVNVNLQFIFAEQLIEFNGKYYIIKDIEESRDTNNKLIVRVRCKEKAIELSYKNIQFLSTTPPLYNAISASANILNIFASKYMILDDLGVSATSNTISVTGADSFSLIGKKVAVVDGTGQGQDRRIVGQSGTSLTVSPNWTTIPDGTSYVKVHDSTWTIGDVDSSFLLDGGTPIYRSFKFEGETITQALQQIAERFEGSLTYSYSYNATYDDFENKVNMVVPNSYDNVEFRYNKNLQRVVRRIDSNEQIYTRMYPFGKNNLSINDLPTQSRTDSGVTYNFHENGQSYIENYQYFLGLGYDIDFCRKNFRYDFDLNNDTYVDAVDLYSDAQNILERASVPKIEYVIQALDLYSLTGYDYEFFDVGDTIRVVDNELGINFFATVIEKPTNWDNPQRSSLILANYIENLGDYITQVINRTNRTADLKKLYGKTATYVIADQATSTNWRQADYFIPQDGSISAGELLQKVLESLDPDDGGEILLLDGIYEFDTNTVSLTSYNNIKIRGLGTSTVLKAKSGITIGIMFDFTTCENITFETLKFGMNTAGDSGTASSFIDFDDSFNLRVENCFVTYARENAIDSNRSNGVYIYNNIFNSDGGLVGGANQSGVIVNATRLNNLEVIGNTFQNYYASVSINYTGNPDDFYEGNVVVSDNYIATNSDDFYICIRMYRSYYNVKITNNRIIRDYGTFIATSISNAIDIQDVNGAEISNNVIDGYFNQAISFGDDDNSINNNIITCMSDISFVERISISGSGNNNKIQNNTVRRYSDRTPAFTPGTGDYGILISSGATNNIVSNNDIRNGGFTANFEDDGTGTVTLGGNAT